MQVSFYLLSEDKAQDFLGFVCQLTQTVLSKSEHGVLIISDDPQVLKQLDDSLWSFSPTSFIPHTLITQAPISQTSASDATTSLHDGEKNTADHSTNGRPVDSQTDNNAPVQLTTGLTQGFDGIVINLSPAPILLTATTSNSSNDSSLNSHSSSSNSSNPAHEHNQPHAQLPERVLEIIQPDSTSTQIGREKYKAYQQQGHRIEHFRIK